MAAIDSSSHRYPLYNDWYMRGALSDVGEIPQTAPGLSGSPDIIPVGALPLPTPQQTLVSTYQQDIGTDVLHDQQNYLWVRAKSFAATPDSGSTQLYSTGESTDVRSTHQTLRPSGCQ